MSLITIRKFNETDIPNKVKWINDDRNNRFLHYDLPLNVENTYKWYLKIRNSHDRYDAVIEVDEIPVGIIGLLNINNGSAEYYVTIGEPEYKGRGIAQMATELLLRYAFFELYLNEVFLYTEIDNNVAQFLFEKCGFRKKGIEHASAVNRGRMVDRYYYAITSNEFKSASY